MGPQLQHPRLEPDVPLSLRLLSANFWGTDYYRSSENLYYRYPPEMRIPVYHKQWQSFYPEHRQDPPLKEYQFFPMFSGERHTGMRYYQGHHFIADVF